MSKKVIGEVMNLEIYRDDTGLITIGDDQILLLSDEDPAQFCQELLAIMTKRSPEQQFIADIQELINEGKRVVPVGKLEAALDRYASEVDL